MGLPDPNPVSNTDATGSFHSTEPGPASSRPGSVTIPGYEIIDALGRGGMGEVYKVRHLALNRVMALKIIRKDQVNSRGALRRFQREMRAAGTVDHSNVVAARDAGEAGGVYYFAMDFFEGIDLKRQVEDKGPLPVEEACEWIRQAALGLQHIQERGLIHRDIKPSNLLLVSESKTVKLLDLGIVLLRTSDEGSENLTETGVMMGTPDYMAPEQITNAHGVDIRADLYSLGCTLHFLLTAQAPFKGGTLLEKLRRHQVEDPPPVEELRKDVPKVVAAVLRKMMAKDPGDRFQTPGEVQTTLQAILHGETTIPDLLIEPGRQSGTSRRKAIIGIAALFAGAGAGIGVWQATRSRAEESVSDGPEMPGQEKPVVEFKPLSGGAGQVLACAFSPDGREVVAAKGNQVHVWDVASGEKTRSIRVPTQVTCAAVAPDSKAILTGAFDGLLRTWDIDSGTNIATGRGHTGKQYTVAFDPDDGTIVSASADKTLRFWNSDLTEKRPPLVHSHEVIGCAFLPGESRIVTCVVEEKEGKSWGLPRLLLWDKKPGSVLKEYPDHAFFPNGFSIEHGGRRKLICAFKGDVCYLNLDDGLSEQPFKHRFGGWDLVLSGNGRRLLHASLGTNSDFWLLNPLTGEAIHHFEEHKTFVMGLAISPDGTRIVSGSVDGSVLLWTVRA